MEVLVSIGVFTIGAVAVASIFPTAIFLQKQTMTDLEMKQAASNAKALIKGRKFDVSTIGTAADTDVTTLPNAIFQQYYPRDRTYPSNYDPNSTSSIWVPLIRDANGGVGDTAWELFVFVLERRSDVTYTKGAGFAYSDPTSFPGVITVGLVTTSASTFLYDQFELAPGTIDALHITPGIEVLDNNGVIYLVEEVTTGGTNDIVRIKGFIPDPPNTSDLWIGHPGDGNRNPTKDIFVLSDLDPTDTFVPSPATTTP